MTGINISNPLDGAIKLGKQAANAVLPQGENVDQVRQQLGKVAVEGEAKTALADIIKNPQGTSNEIAKSITDLADVRFKNQLSKTEVAHLLHQVLDDKNATIAPANYLKLAEALERVNQGLAKKDDGLSFYINDLKGKASQLSPGHAAGTQPGDARPTQPDLASTKPSATQSSTTEPSTKPSATTQGASTQPAADQKVVVTAASLREATAHAVAGAQTKEETQAALDNYKEILTRSGVPAERIPAELKRVAVAAVELKLLDQAGNRAEWRIRSNCREILECAGVGTDEKSRNNEILKIADGLKAKVLADTTVYPDQVARMAKSNDIEEVVRGVRAEAGRDQQKADDIHNAQVAKDNAVAAATAAAEKAQNAAIDHAKQATTNMDKFRADAAKDMTAPQSKESLQAKMDNYRHTLELAGKPKAEVDKEMKLVAEQAIRNHLETYAGKNLGSSVRSHCRQLLEVAGVAMDQASEHAIIKAQANMLLAPSSHVDSKKREHIGNVARGL